MVLAAKHCKPCSGKVSPLSPEAAAEMLKQTPKWQQVEGGKAIERHFKFSNFNYALSFVKQIAEIAERENHHPDITFGWGYCDVKFSTHSIGGLHENDFIAAAKINAIALD